MNPPPLMRSIAKPEIRRVGAIRTMSMSSLIPRFGMLWGRTFLREG